MSQDISAFLLRWNHRRTSGVLVVEVEADLRGQGTLDVLAAIRMDGLDAVVAWCVALHPCRTHALPHSRVHVHGGRGRDVGAA